jgi:hypothetical protein
VELAIGCNEYLLRHVFSIVEVAQSGVGVSIDAPLVFVYKEAKRRRVPLKALMDDIAIFGPHFYRS